MTGMRVMHGAQHRSQLSRTSMPVNSRIEAHHRVKELELKLVQVALVVLEELAVVAVAEGWAVPEAVGYIRQIPVSGSIHTYQDSGDRQSNASGLPDTGSAACLVALYGFGEDQVAGTAGTAASVSRGHRGQASA
jgi:hypothetical protein